MYNYLLNNKASRLGGFIITNSNDSICGDGASMVHGDASDDRRDSMGLRLF